LAAGDIIGHLDDWEANVLCAEAVDKALTTICAGAAEHNYAVAVTADHGLLEKFVKADGSHNLSHTTSPVPFGLVLPPEGPSVQLQDSEDASLADVAPTLLKIMGISQPAAMTGQARSIPEGTYQRLVLVVLDGWGLGVQDPAVNPIAAARTPCLDQIEKKGPYLSLAASGPAVGLPRGRSGNSETGHLTLGAGRVIPQDELRIAQAVEAGELVGNKALNYGLESALARQGQIHFLLLLSERSSHGNLAEGLAVLKAAAAKGIKKAWLHLILDGRSSPPQASANLLKLLKKGIPAGIQVEIATAVGRSFALDRSGGYQDKTRIAYEALVLGKGIPF
ncbi:MAG: hypothetical protein GX335_04455, partial [Firmicutes bacterium]|nr:hypothetical protein [Bacillota bacterium]